MAELQFSGSRRDLAVEKGYVQLLCWWGSVCVCVCWGRVGGGKRKKQREKGKEESHELSLKMNEKMGNPRVTA